jgi:membrane fusion protein (multidrug efflux system)
VRVQIEQGVDSDAIAIPAQAVRRNDTGGAEVFVVNSENRALIQPVRTGRMVDGEWIILDGLKGGDRVVIEGFQKFAAGSTVDPTPWSPVRAAASADAEKPKAN